jgi:hypothetical protein
MQSKDETYMPESDAIEQSICESFVQFVIKLNEDQLKPMIVKLVKWAYRKKDEEKSFPYNLHRTTVLFRAVKISFRIYTCIVEQPSRKFERVLCPSDVPLSREKH